MRNVLDEQATVSTKMLQPKLNLRVSGHRKVCGQKYRSFQLARWSKNEHLCWEKYMSVSDTPQQERDDNLRVSHSYTLCMEESNSWAMDMLQVILSPAH